MDLIGFIGSPLPNKIWTPTPSEIEKFYNKQKDNVERQSKKSENQINLFLQKLSEKVNKETQTEFSTEEAVQFCSLLKKSGYLGEENNCSCLICATEKLEYNILCELQREIYVIRMAKNYFIQSENKEMNVLCYKHRSLQSLQKNEASCYCEYLPASGLTLFKESSNTANQQPRHFIGESSNPERSGVRRFTLLPGTANANIQTHAGQSGQYTLLTRSSGQTRPFILTDSQSTNQSTQEQFSQFGGASANNHQFSQYGDSSSSEQSRQSSPRLFHFESANPPPGYENGPTNFSGLYSRPVSPDLSKIEDVENGTFVIPPGENAAEYIALYYDWARHFHNDKLGNHKRLSYTKNIKLQDGKKTPEEIDFPEL